MDGVVNLQFIQMLMAYVFVVILLAIVKVKGINREKEILLATFRMTIQLVITGYVLVYLFNNVNIVYTMVVIAFMEAFAIFNTFKRLKIRTSKNMKRVITIAMIFGTISSLLFFIIAVIQIRPWYDPRYFISIAGMILGNSLTGLCLAITRLTSGMNLERDSIECSLMLGATSKMACKHIVNDAFDSAILPTVNSMLGMGIVFLPGMMTGQILSGTSPVTAIKYQIAIMLAVLGSVTLTTIIAVQLGYKTFFNEDEQLNIE